MEADFSGWVTKAGLKCTDGRTITPGAFRHQDKMQVPLVWQHGHNDPENVLGHVVLENRDDGVYGYAYFNTTGKAEHARNLVEHKDINQMSIWANQLVERSKQVLHGMIREVSLVLAGANPGAIIENVTIRHSGDDELETLEDEALIQTGLTLEHSQPSLGLEEKETVEVPAPEVIPPAAEIVPPKSTTTIETPEPETPELQHKAKDDTPVATAQDDMTVQDVYDSLTDDQKNVVNYLIGEAIDAAGDGGDDSMSQSAFNDAVHSALDLYMKGSEMRHNVFEGAPAEENKTLSHDALDAIVSEAKKSGSLKAAFEEYALAHGIENVDVMFPEATLLDGQPQFLQRRTEWVADWMAGTSKSPFSRLKSLTVDLTYDEARAKGYVTGALKKEEFVKAMKRTTVPTTVYKKQRLERDDVVDITDFDVVVWLKAEMRLMLDEEVARASLVGDGRAADDDDKIDEDCIRPIATDNDVYVTKVYVNIDDANSSIQEVIDSIIGHAAKYKGSGNPNFYTTAGILAKFRLLKDTLGRRIYANMSDLADELGVKNIIPVEAMEETPSVVGIIVNPVDYVFGATRGGEVNMFDNFDIDYNAYRYLIETRMSGALRKPKSAVVIYKTASNATLVSPAAPVFDPATGHYTIVNQTGVVYKNSAGTTVNAGGSPYTIPSGETDTITATPASSSYYFDSSDNDSWTFETD